MTQAFYSNTKVGRQQSSVFKILRENDFHIRIPYLAKLLIS